MTRTQLSRLTLVILLVSFIAPSLLARSEFLDKVDKQRKALGYSFRIDRAKLKTLEDRDAEMASESSSGIVRNTNRLVSLGAAGNQDPTVVPGFIVDNSYEDWQWSQTERGVDFRGTPDVHFVYMDQETPTNGVGDRHGYNVYSPFGGGDWPQGAAKGCEIGNIDERGRWPAMDVNSDGFVTITGSFNVDPQGTGTFDPRVDFQTSQYSCFFGAGTLIPPSLYTINMGNPASNMNRPGVEYQEWLGDTVIHIVGNESNFTDFTGTGVTETVIQHFRKSGKTVAGTWEGPQTIDSAFFRGTIASSRVSPKVAIFYVHATALGYTLPGTSPGGNNVWTDLGIFYRESDSLGFVWNPPVEITPTDRTVPSWNPRIRTTGLYDSEDGLHIVWTGRPQPANVYTDSLETFFFFDFSGSLFHWSNRTNMISRIANGDYGLVANIPTCGWQNNLYVAYFSLGECDGNLYAVWSQTGDWFDVNNRGHQSLDDCSSDGSIRAQFNGNADVYMSVSSSLDGLLWDFQRNLTDTYTPNCDSAAVLGGNGECGHETKPALARYGMDEAAMTAIFGTLNWPTEATFDPTGTYTGNFYTHLFYLEDKWSGQAALTAANQGPYTLNPLRWVRLACVDPITAPQIAVSLSSIGFPEQTNHGVPRIETITVTNDGNAPLNISSIQTIEDTGPTGWLSTSVPSLTVQAGATNTATFDMILNTGGIVNSPGTIVALSGRVRLISDAPTPLDTVDIEITNFIVGAVAPLVWDTVSTGATRLTISNHGSMGNSGLGGANLDYSFAGSTTPDCDTTSRVTNYVFDGSPLVIQAVDITNGVFNMSTNIFSSGFAPTRAFNPLPDKTLPSHFVGPGGSDAFATGTFTNQDSTVAIERTYYAPTGGSPNDDFIIVKTQFFSNDGLPHNNLLLGDVIDWDTPSEVGANNTAGISGRIVYLQGVDTSSVPPDPLCLFGSRYSASAFLGMYDAGEFANDACANNTNRWGAYAADNTGSNPAAQGAPNGAIDSALAWQQGGALTGEWSTVDTAVDQRITQTFVFDYNLAANDTLTVYTAMTTVMNGTLDDLKANVTNACDWYNANLRPGCTVCSCCKGSTGNVDNDPGDVVDIADLTFLIDHLFITFPALACAEEGNVDGDPAGVVDIADLTFLIDHLFISFPPTSPCQ